MLGLAGEPLLGEFLLGELLLTPLNMLARSQLCPGLCTVLVGSLLPAPLCGDGRTGLREGPSAEQ